MKVLVIGSGGREHALVWKLAQSPQLSRLHAAPGSAAIGDLAPDRVRGLVTGLQGSATTLGIAIATPLAGVLVDTASPGVAMLACGSVAVVAAGVAAPLLRVRA